MIGYVDEEPKLERLGSRAGVAGFSKGRVKVNKLLAAAIFVPFIMT